MCNSLMSMFARVQSASLTCLWCAIVVVQTASAQPNEQLFRDPSFEQLAAVRITSVGKTEEAYFTAPAAVYVISSQDIRRSGARSIPEALRLAPGVEVARINTHRYAISIRGFNGEFANKLLVLMDGRSLYTPLFAGTFWDFQDTFLDDVERIEVIRGPGGTTWGANAVNGVINIITRDARDTQGVLAVAGGGNEERAFAGIRYGSQIGEDIAYRFFVQGFERDASIFPSGIDSGDDFRQSRAGFRIDARPNARDHFALHGDVFTGEADQIALNRPDTIEQRGGYVLGKWARSQADGGELSAQFYYDDKYRESFQGISDREAVDLDVVHRVRAGSNNWITWGLNTRYSENGSYTAPGLAFNPADRSLLFAGMFLDGDIELVPQRWRTTAGVKLEYNSFTQWEVLPNVRLTYTPSSQQTFWSSVTRGLRMPSITDHDATTALTRLVSYPNPELPPEKLNAFEVGWRAQWLTQLTSDVSLFEHRYTSLRTRDSAFDAPMNMLVVTRNDGMSGRAHGVEATLAWNPETTWRVQASYGYTHLDFELEDGSRDVAALREAGDSPRHQVRLAGFVSIFNNHEFSLQARYVDDLPSLAVDEYVEADAQWTWSLPRSIELSVTGRNLLHSSHVEFRPSSSLPLGSDVERSGHLTLRWRQR
jgi:iron complex outermembrane receptor protein